MRKYILTNGDESVDLLNPTLEQGYMAVRGGLTQGTVAPEMEFTGIYPDGARMSSYSFQPAIENWTLNLKAGDQNMAAAQLHSLFRLLRQAREYHLTKWQLKPVWIEAQASQEWKTRYSLVYGMLSREFPDLYKVPFEVDSELEDMRISLARDPFWASHAPKKLGRKVQMSVKSDRYPGLSDLNSGSMWWVTNGRHGNEITHIFNYDDSASSFSANWADEYAPGDPWNYFQVSGSTPAQNDIVYFGSTAGPFYQVLLWHTAPSGYNGAVWLEYYNGSNWIRVNDGSDNGAFPAGQFGPQNNFGPMLAKFGGKTDWAMTTINGVNAWWLRLRLVTSSTITTQATQDGQPVLAIRDNYIEYETGSVVGDEPALAQIKLYPMSSAGNKVNWLIMGMKSRGLDNFISALNLGGDGNPASWSVAATDSDTTFDSDPSSPGGKRATFTFATSPTAHGSRMNITYSAATNRDFSGDYRVFLRCKQVGGSAGAVQVSMRHREVSGVRRPLQGVGVVEAVDLGILTLFPYPPEEGDTSSQILMGIVVEASATSSTPDLHCYDLVLIPIDEWSAIVSGIAMPSPNPSNAEMVIFDGGVQRRGALFARQNEKLNEQRSDMPWEVAGELPKLPPHRKFRIYFMFVSASGSLAKFEAGNELSMAVEINVHERWHVLRGLDGVFTFD